MSRQRKIVCFGSAGNQFGNNTKCPDSDSCCQTTEQCRPDRLCSSNNDPDTLIRAPCSVYPWNGNCAKVCIEEDSSGFLPRVNICADGSYCCVKDATCCVDKRGFFLNDDGTIKSRANETMPEPTSSSTEPSAIITTAVPTDGSITGSITTSPPAATSSADNPQPASSGLSQPAKFGVGFGVAFGVVFLFLIAFFAWRKRQQKNRLQMNPAAYPTYGQTRKTGDVPVELPAPNNPPLSELDGYYSQGSRK
ncbi:hypothetical protein RJZ56_003492 [Blastomyces dermatitidis]|uniref:Mid2 domain-containing protein n=2 Tax=Blastomyces TaxID=229219 RepID=A0A179UTT0_BLAGS|nr:uncharacterized protein BDBG_06280 [Blastomyces gilchristii SLH14081]EGE83404.1 hypothetical protein BDDG_06348 [Blastomyces dermatitidis ATCC 18188]OAT10441.1 hypothetical protein BDBG_06280 [Blastomyces gilchristii SLH14081]